MSKTLVDIDDELLADAQAALGTRTKKDTITQALRNAVAEQMRRAEFEFWAQGGTQDLADPAVMDEAWR
ncbi:MAG: type II toxin-antitoxin system VapB family antitoxin [Nocardiopsaceae bacterium]|nr:type II toxin-antitoxin system VapB family antitoxin [Nocardiopsaceae bacterium]